MGMVYECGHSGMNIETITTIVQNNIPPTIIAQYSDSISNIKASGSNVGYHMNTIQAPATADYAIINGTLSLGSTSLNITETVYIGDPEIVKTVANGSSNAHLDITFNSDALLTFNLYNNSSTYPASYSLNIVVYS